MENEPRSLKIVLPGERPSSWNKMYAGTHWGFRKQEAERIHRDVAAMLLVMGYRPMPKKPVFPGLVDITLTAYFANRPLDPDNIPAKFYIDGLKLILFDDDTRQYIDSVTTRSRVDKENPRVEIELREVAADARHVAVGRA